MLLMIMDMKLLNNQIIRMFHAMHDHSQPYIFILVVVLSVQNLPLICTASW